ncbi:MAG: pyridoxal phosphate-dependent aminotransferase [Candidatus Omnitrophota bacterium]|nr:pyridoxal phosphate-dependent aminotransferase [Candidatus Omnitrophota bacterium]
MTINPRVAALSASSTLKITALAKKLIKDGKDVVNFAAGEPDFDTPDFVKIEAKRAIDEGFTKYTPSSGMIELREAIAAKLQHENRIPCSSKNIIVTTGAKYALFAALVTLLAPDDEVVIPSPYWVSYPEMVTLIGGRITYLHTRPENNFKIRIQDLAASIGSKTKVVILNYPANPTGMSYTRNELAELYEFLRDKKIFVLSDEIYEKLTYDKAEFTSFASFPGADRWTVTVNGFSKSFSMTGWRIGYMVADEAIVRETSKVIDHTTSCVSSVSQRAAVAALKNSTWQEQMCVDFQKKRDALYQGLRDFKKILPLRPQGSFYMFCDITKTGLSSEEFSSQLLERHQVCVIPTNSFGAEGYVRLSFATSFEDIAKGIVRIKKFLAE